MLAEPLSCWSLSCVVAKGVCGMLYSSLGTCGISLEEEEEEEEEERCLFNLIS